MSTMTAEEIRRALHDSHGLPHGAARNAHAEALTAAAEVCGDSEVFRLALVNQIDAYEYSAERSRMVVPFARLLQEYDRDPAAFDGGDVHSLFWRFKWVSGQIISSPDVPISAVTGYLADMDRRYRIAGYSERAVRQSEYFLADAIGDDERAERAVAQWRAADRDAMSDCHACETNSQGTFWATKGEHAKAIEIWEPVLNGTQTCMEEPHRVLARSLKPLLLLGRTDEARSHHLRGYRMTRGKESLLRALGQHIEFCALTGNEARGVEILAEHSTHLRPLVDVKTQMDFYGGVVVLLRRLVELGHGADPTVPYEGSARTVGELHGVLRGEALAIAARFDARNGTTRVSDRLLKRMAQAPLVDVLPLGVRSTALPQPAEAPAPVPRRRPHPRPRRVRGARRAGAGRPRHGSPGFRRLVGGGGRTDLRAPRGGGGPGAARRCGRPPGTGGRTGRSAGRGAAAGSRPGRLPRPGTVGTLRPRRASAGERGRAGRGRAGRGPPAAGRGTARRRGAGRGGTAAGPPDRDRGTVRAAPGAVPALRRDRAGARPRTRPRAGEGHDHGHTALEAELTSFVDSYAEALPDLAAEGEELLGRLLLSRGETDRALPLLAASAAHAVAAGRPWHAVDPLVLRAGVLMSLDRPEEAEEAARSGLEHAAQETDAEQQGVVRITLADVLLRRDAAAEAAEHALTAAHWFDQAGLTADGGAQARLLLARAYAREGRTADAAEVLQSTLPDLLEHGEGQAVSARDFLGNLLRDLRESRAAAEQFLLAAELVKGWEDPRPQAAFAQSAADCLSDAGLAEEAVAAYERALELRRLTGEAVVSEVRILRSLAWLGLREEVTDATVAAARARMDEAARVLEAALASDPGEPELRSELAQTWHQLAQVLDRRVGAELPGEEGAAVAGGTLGAAGIEALRLEEVLLWERAAALYTELGPAYLQDRFQCLNNAAWTDQELGRPAVGAARISALIEEVEALPGGTAPEWLLPQARRVVTNLTA